MTNRTALVTGSGIGGLAVAVSLLRAGRSPVVLAEAAVVEPLQGAVFLDVDALTALDALGVGEPVRSRARIAPDPATGGFSLEVARVDVQTALLEALGTGRVRTGCSICCARQDARLARVHLIDRGDVAAPLLVDTLGPDSPVRVSVLGRKKAARSGLARRAAGRVAFVGGELEALADAVALASALHDEPILADALDSFARTPRTAPAPPARRRPGRAPRLAVAPA